MLGFLIMFAVFSLVFAFSPDDTQAAVGGCFKVVAAFVVGAILSCLMMEWVFEHYPSVSGKILWLTIPGGGMLMVFSGRIVGFVCGQTIGRLLTASDKRARARATSARSR